MPVASLEHCQAAIYGLSGVALTAEEVDFFQHTQPWGVILFARNIENRAQLLDLTNQLKQITCRQHLPILIDQEGGSVARLRPPHARLHPPAALYGQIYDTDKEKALTAAKLGGYLLGQELDALGISINCLPCLDVGRAETTDIIGDRSYASDPEIVATLGRAMADGLMQAGVLPVMKHMPGHGRGTVDSHKALPQVDTPEAALVATDFAPFKACHDLPVGMTAHVQFTDLDADNPATQSAVIINQIIRQHIGFDGLLMGDDISMEALSGALPERALASLAAGCDLILHCDGNMAQMQDLAAVLPKLAGQSLKRAQKIEEILQNPPRVAVKNAQKVWEELLCGHFPNGTDGV